MEKKELENLLMRFSHLGVIHSKNGALLIGKAPHIAEYAWLNVMYPCVTETEVCDLAFLGRSYFWTSSRLNGYHESKSLLL